MAVTIENLGTNSIVGSPTSTTLALKGIDPQGNFTLGETATEITINAYDNAPTFDYCLVTNSMNTSVTTTIGNFTFDTSTLDPSGMHDVTNTERINILQDGLYTISSLLSTQANAGTIVETYLNWYDSTTMNTTIIGFATCYTTFADSANNTTIYPLTAGDYLYLSAISDSGTQTILAAGYSPWFSVARIGPK